MSGYRLILVMYSHKSTGITWDPNDQLTGEGLLRCWVSNTITKIGSDGLKYCCSVTDQSREALYIWPIVV